MISKLVPETYFMISFNHNNSSTDKSFSTRFKTIALLHWEPNQLVLIYFKLSWTVSDDLSLRSLLGCLLAVTSSSLKNNLRPMILAFFLLDLFFVRVAIGRNSHLLLHWLIYMIFFDFWLRRSKHCGVGIKFVTFWFELCWSCFIFNLLLQNGENSWTNLQEGKNYKVTKMVGKQGILYLSLLSISVQKSPH